jgi:hypothetical protein
MRRRQPDSPTAIWKVIILGMVSHEHAGDSRGLGRHLLERRKLLRIDRSVFVHAALDMPSSKIAPARPRKRS